MGLGLKNVEWYLVSLYQWWRTYSMCGTVGCLLSLKAITDLDHALSPQNLGAEAGGLTLW